jgi:hypothetical protein
MLKGPITRFKAILAELLHYGRAAAESTADLQFQLARLASALAPLQGRLDELERLVAMANSEEVQLARLASALAPLQVQLERLEGEVVKAGGEIVSLQNVVANVNHAFGAKPWPNLFDPFATDEIASRTFRLGNLLTPVATEGHRKVRVGHPYDGGYVMIDDWNGIVGAISIGIGRNDAWDRDVQARGIPVAQFDHTIAAPPTYAPGMVWHRIGIGPDDTKDLRSLRSIVRLADFPAEGDLLLKLDAEAAEWEALQSEEAAPLGRFRQMVIEFHWFDRIADDTWFTIARQTIERVCRSHAPVHVHANNGVGMMLLGGVTFPRVLEVTFAKKSVYTLTPSHELFPTALDAPCHSGRPDHFLGSFRFPAP